MNLDQQYSTRLTILAEYGVKENGNELIIGDDAVDCMEVYNMDDAQFQQLVDYLKSLAVSYLPAPVQQQQLSVIEKGNETLQHAGAILQKLQITAQKGETAAKALLAEIGTNQLTPELDQKCNNLLILAATRAKEAEETYKPITATMDIIRGHLLDTKKAFDVKEKSSPFYLLQQKRNEYATWCESERRRVAKEAADKAAKDRAIIDLKAEFEKRLFASFNTYVTNRKQQLNNIFNAITLETFEEKKAWFIGIIPTYTDEHFSTITCPLPVTSWWGLFPNEIDNLYRAWLAENAARLAASYTTQYYNELCAIRNTCNENMQSKFNELTNAKRIADEKEAQRVESERLKAEQAQANEARRKEIAAEQEKLRLERQETERAEKEAREAREKREREEAAELERQQQQAASANNTQVESKAIHANTMSLFDQSMNGASVGQEGPKTKVQLKAKLKSALGLYPIFMLWFENEGHKMDLDKLESKFDFIFNYAKKRANAAKNPLQVQHEFVEYVEDITAVKVKGKEAEGE